MTDSDVGKLFIFVEACPLCEAGTEASWKKAECWDWTEDGAAVRMRNHLMLSSHHKVTREEADELIGITSFTEDAYVEQPEPAQKTQRWQPSEPPPTHLAKRAAIGAPMVQIESTASSSSSGTVTICRDVLVSAIGPSNDFAREAQNK